MKDLKELLHENIPDAMIQICAMEENSEDMSGWMLKHGYSKRVKNKLGRFSHYEYVLTEKGRNYIDNEYNCQILKLDSKIKGNYLESEDYFIKTIKSFMKNHYDEYERQKSELNRRELLAIQHFEKRIW